MAACGHHRPFHDKSNPSCRPEPDLNRFRSTPQFWQRFRWLRRRKWRWRGVPQVECAVMKAISRAAIAGEWEAYACGVRFSMTTRRRHRNSSNEQPISLDHGALLHAADSSGEPVDSQHGLQSQQLGAWPVQHTPWRCSSHQPEPARRARGSVSSTIRGQEAIFRFAYRRVTQPGRATRARG